MAQGDQLRGFFRRHDAGYARHSQRIPFLYIPRKQDGHCLWRQLHNCRGCCHPVCVGFFRNINHMGLSSLIEMGKF